jgi:hypothetical protein
MNTKLKENERELIKIVNFFRKKAEKLLKEGKLSPEHAQVVTACESLVLKLENNASMRHEVTQRRESLKGIIKDHAECPKCHKNTHLKYVGTDKNDKGWQSNKYKCRRCNIEFVWNRPNNAWNMIPYLEEVIKEMEQRIKTDKREGQTQEQLQDMISQMQQTLAKLQPLIEESDNEYRDMETLDSEMAKMIHGFKNHLLIEKIKMDSWEEQ